MTYVLWWPQYHSPQTLVTFRLSIRLHCAMIRRSHWRIVNRRNTQEARRWHYNTKRPHSSLGYKPPAPEAIKPIINLTKKAIGLT